MRAPAKCMLAGLMASSALASVAHDAQAADDWPTRPITLVVAYAPGGMTDLVTRNLANELTKRLGQTIVVENKAGAGGQIGAQYVATQAPNGYTLLVGATGQVVNPAVKKHMPFNTRTAFTPIALLAMAPNLIVTSPATGVSSFGQLKDYASKHGSLPFATAGAATVTHIIGEQLKATTGLPFVHVPYKGGGPAMVDVVAGQVPFAIVDSVAAASFVKAGKLKALAVTTAQRSAMFPDAPTLKELGYPDFDDGSWIGLYGPAGLPPEMVKRINEAARAGSLEQGPLEYIRSTGSVPGDLDPAGFSAFVNGELTKWDTRVSKLKIESD